MNIDLKYTLKKTVELLAIPSPVGYTHMAIEWVRKELESLGVKKYNITKKGALIAYVKGKDSNYKKMISAHVDTLGAVVKKVKKNGRLEITNVGGFAWGSVEGEHVTIHTLSEKTYTGTILPIKASVHVYGDVAREMPRTEETMEIRIDEDVKTDQDVFKLGILQGDFVSLDPRTRVLENGYIKSRYLDDKLCVAQILTYLKYLKDNKLKPRTDLYIYFSNFEEIGHGVSVFPEDLDEFIAVDIGLVAGEDAHGDEKKVNIIAKDSRSPYDYTLRKKLQEAADKNKIQYTVGVHNRYGSDATTAILQGFDFKYACIGPNVDATHHYERCHNDGIVETIKLLIAYL
ncbi:peptidase M42 [Fusobacterium pseudoperiodonticum]|uniref:M42 family metallopeptidase n=1 Tax=Fusobacterium pseudoperiodonticum TaxID=2663009 RepID=UPI000C1B3729|nr:M42 family metallopeptidase [Fusobacterium pseudoperiodonticum]ATV58007.1 peptidase M42 [Fusobacterium pseudoperiodonticum]ATV63660.1 peptidase M42 [Fusobacterium pseudoperiodonticum]ATV71724.1 peptidase M42 [Fusobacterium pseudoperiodonticum]PIM77673.1 peptidase M42 [Fusobacterium pseudoperiodonticum]